MLGDQTGFGAPGNQQGGMAALGGGHSLDAESDVRNSSRRGRHRLISGP